MAFFLLEKKALFFINHDALRTAHRAHQGMHDDHNENSLRVLCANLRGLRRGGVVNEVRTSKASPYKKRPGGCPFFVNFPVMHPAKQINQKTISIRLISIGFFLIGLGAIVFSDTWVRSSDLFIYRGTVRAADFFVTNKTSKNIKNRTTKYRQADLIFKLNEFENGFILSEDIGNENTHQPFSDLRNAIRESDSLFIGINADERNAFTPRVFEITNGKGKTLYAVADATSGNRMGFLISATAGVILICIGVVYLLPPAIKRKIGF